MFRDDFNIEIVNRTLMHCLTCSVRKAAWWMKVTTAKTCSTTLSFPFSGESPQQRTELLEDCKSILELKQTTDMKHKIKKNHCDMALIPGLLFPALAQDPAENTAAEPRHIPARKQADNLVLDLQGAVDHAITYNKSLKNARMEVERSRASVWESIAQGLPQVDGAVDYMTYFNYEMEFKFGMGGEGDLLHRRPDR